MIDTYGLLNSPEIQCLQGFLPANVEIMCMDFVRFGFKSVHMEVRLCTRIRNVK